MRLVVTALIFLTGLFDLFMAVSFLLDPGSAGAGLGVAAIGMAGGPQARQRGFRRSARTSPRSSASARSA
jgi:hypothetical protein